MHKKWYLIALAIPLIVIGIFKAKVLMEQQATTTTPVIATPQGDQHLAPAPAPSQTPQAQSRTISVTNNITRKMLRYKYGFINVRPSKFNISIDDVIIEPGETKQINITNNKLVVAYYYDFSGHREGKCAITLDIKPEAQDVNISFSWDDDYRVLADSGQAVNKQEIEL